MLLDNLTEGTSWLRACMRDLTIIRGGRLHIGQLLLLGIWYVSLNRVLAYGQNDYDAMGDYLAFHPKGTSKSIYKAIIDVQSGEYPSAYHHIQKAQSLAHDELQNQLAIGPQVALKTLAKTECLVELNEVIQYKSQPEMREHILSVWRARFKRSHDDPNSWLKRLQVWTLACDPTTPALQHCYLDCAKLCESNGMHEVAKRILERVTPPVHPPVRPQHSLFFEVS
jgi:FKBP12-rapamycin complex-associated protein